MEAVRHQRLDPLLGGRSTERSDARIPPGTELNVRRQAGVDEAFGVGDRPFVDFLSKDTGVVRQNSIGITYCRHAPPSFEFAAPSIFESLTPRGNVKNRSLGGPVDLMHAGGAHPWAGLHLHPLGARTVESATGPATVVLQPEHGKARFGGSLPPAAG